MIEEARRGGFITLEGGEGAGKSTQAGFLKAWLEGMGHKVNLTREPGGSPRAECLRDLLLAGRVAPFGAEAEALMFAVARADHVIETIRPALQKGEWVICDRFIDSTRAYQGSAGVPAKRLDELEAIAVGATMPDLTIILDLPPQEGLARAKARGSQLDRFEADALALHEARHDAFLKIAAANPGRCAVVDATSDKNTTFDRIKTIVGKRLPELLNAGAQG